MAIDKKKLMIIFILIIFLAIISSSFIAAQEDSKSVSVETEKTNEIDYANPDNYGNPDELKNMFENGVYSQIDWSKVQWDKLPPETDWENVKWNEVKWNDIPADQWDKIPWDKVNDNGWQSIPPDNMPNIPPKWLAKSLYGDSDNSERNSYLSPEQISKISVAQWEYENNLNLCPDFNKYGNAREVLEDRYHLDFNANENVRTVLGEETVKGKKGYYLFNEYETTITDKDTGEERVQKNWAKLDINLDNLPKPLIGTDFAFTPREDGGWQIKRTETFKWSTHDIPYGSDGDKLLFGSTDFTGVPTIFIDADGNVRLDQFTGYKTSRDNKPEVWNTGDLGHELRICPSPNIKTCQNKFGLDESVVFTDTTTNFYGFDKKEILRSEHSAIKVKSEEDLPSYINVYTEHDSLSIEEADSYKEDNYILAKDEFKTIDDLIQAKASASDFDGGPTATGSGGGDPGALEQYSNDFYKDNLDLSDEEISELKADGSSYLNLDNYQNPKLCQVCMDANGCFQDGMSKSLRAECIYDAVENTKCGEINCWFK